MFRTWLKEPLARLGNWLEESQAKRLGKWCARGALIAGLAAREKYKDKATDYAWLAARAMSTAVNWATINEWEFVYTPSGEKITILPQHSLLDVVKLEVAVETRWATRTLSPARRAELIRIAVESADAYIRQPVCHCRKGVEDTGARGARSTIGGQYRTNSYLEETIRTTDAKPSRRLALSEKALSTDFRKSASSA